MNILRINFFVFVSKSWMLSLQFPLRTVLLENFVILQFCFIQGNSQIFYTGQRLDLLCRATVRSFIQGNSQIFYTGQQLDLLYRATVRSFIQGNSQIFYTGQQLDLLFRATVRSFIINISDFLHKYKYIKFHTNLSNKYLYVSPIQFPKIEIQQSIPQLSEIFTLNYVFFNVFSNINFLTTSLK